MPGMNRHTGRTIRDAERDRQRLNILLQTPVGSRLQRRQFGSVLPFMVDQPLSNATVLRMFAATAAAVRVWLPDIRLDAMRLAQPGHNGQIALELDASVGSRSNAGQTQQTTRILINGGVL